eukprot:SAG11_NODE_15994_length_560_cov_0.895879_1_plen_77_part_10
MLRQLGRAVVGAAATEWLPHAPLVRRSVGGVASPAAAAAVFASQFVGKVRQHLRPSGAKSSEERHRGRTLIRAAPPG